jgi:hypothetical protein
MRFFAAAATLQEPDEDPEHRFDFLGPRPTHSSESDEVLGFENFMIDGEPVAALDVLIVLCENAPNDDVLCFLGVRLVEPLLDLHWKQIGSAFEAEARRRLSLRKALSCAWLDLKGRGSHEMEQRLLSLLPPREDTGRGPQ